jgi:hypothetical protein
VRLGLNDEIQLASPKSVTAKSALLAPAVTHWATHVIDTVNGQMTLGWQRDCVITISSKRLTTRDLLARCEPNSLDGRRYVCAATHSEACLPT